MQIGNLVRTEEEETPASVGMGATILFVTDRVPCTVVACSQSGKTITLQRDRAVSLAVDPSGFQANPRGTTWRARRTTAGWRTLDGTSKKVLLGVRDSYRDPTF